MKLRKALAVLAFLAVAILPVAAAPAAITGDVYAGAMWDFGTAYNAMGDVNVYFKAQVDDFTYVYVNLGRALLTYSAAYNATANSVFEAMKNDYCYATLDLAKYFAMDKQLLAQLSAGYYYWGTAAYASKLALAYPRIAYKYTTAPNWAFMVNVGVPALAGVKLIAAPVALSSAGAPYAMTNDWMAVPYLNLNLGNGMTANADACYYQNKNANLGQGLICAEGDFNMTAGMLVVNAGAGIEMNLATTGGYFKYMVSGKGTYYLDEKKTTLVLGAVGVNGYFPNTGTSYALYQVEIDAQATLNPLVDILEVVSLDLSSTTAPFRSSDTCFRFNFGNTDVNLGYIYGNNVGGTYSSQNLPNGGLYLRTYFPF